MILRIRQVVVDHRFEGGDDDVDLYADVDLPFVPEIGSTLTLLDGDIDVRIDAVTIEVTGDPLYPSGFMVELWGPDRGVISSSTSVAEMAALYVSSGWKVLPS